MVNPMVHLAASSFLLVQEGLHVAHHAEILVRKGEKKPPAAKHAIVGVPAAAAVLVADELEHLVRGESTALGHHGRWVCLGQLAQKVSVHGAAEPAGQVRRGPAGGAREKGAEVACRAFEARGHVGGRGRGREQLAPERGVHDAVAHHAAQVRPAVLGVGAGGVAGQEGGHVGGHVCGEAGGGRRGDRGRRGGRGRKRRSRDRSRDRRRHGHRGVERRHHGAEAHEAPHQRGVPRLAVRGDARSEKRHVGLERARRLHHARKRLERHRKQVGGACAALEAHAHLLEEIVAVARARGHVQERGHVQRGRRSGGNGGRNGRGGGLELRQAPRLGHLVLARRRAHHASHQLLHMLLEPQQVECALRKRRAVHNGLVPHHPQVVVLGLAAAAEALGPELRERELEQLAQLGVAHHDAAVAAVLRRGVLGHERLAQEIVHLVDGVARDGGHGAGARVFHNHQRGGEQFERQKQPPHLVDVDGRKLALAEVCAREILLEALRLREHRQHRAEMPHGPRKPPGRAAAVEAVAGAHLHAPVERGVVVQEVVEGVQGHGGALGAEEREEVCVEVEGVDGADLPEEAVQVGTGRDRNRAGGGS